MKILSLLLGVVMFVSCANEDSNKTIHYTISTHTEKNTSELKLKMNFPAEVDGETILLFQDQAWGQDSLHNVLASMKVLNAEATITTQRDSGWVIIKHHNDVKELEFEYTLQQDTEVELTTMNTYRPIIQPEYFHVFAHNLLMLPEKIVRPEGSKFNVNITWEGFATDYSLVNSFGSNELVQSIENTSEEKFHNAVFVGGDFRVHNLNIEGNKVVFAIRGDWEVVKDTALTAILNKTIRTQRSLWQDHTQDYFAITMIPTVLERGSGFQGSGLTNSFAVNATNNEYLELEGLVYLFNHELQHNWTGHVIRNDDEEKQYWFSEGFTDYYTLKNIAREQIHNLDESYFITKFNTFIQELYTSPVKEMPNSELTYENFWGGQEGIQKLPYRRGALFAFYLDHKIQKDSNGEKSLDDVLLEFKNDAIANDQKLTHPYFVEVVNNYLTEDVQPFFNKHIEEGKLFDLEAIFTDFGFDFEPTATVFDLGFELSEDRESVISINEPSNAYKAGLRAGDKVTGISYYRSPTFPANFKVLRNGKEVEIEYVPAKAAKIPQLKDNELNKRKLSS
jgi:predicted metalloprotease with PDZ domain